MYGKVHRIIVITSSSTKLSWPEDGEGAFRSSRQADTCLRICHIQWKHHTVLYNAERQAETCKIFFFLLRKKQPTG